MRSDVSDLIPLILDPAADEKSSTSEMPRGRLASMRGAISKKFRSVLAFGLVLWCAGAGCILISYAHGAAMSRADSLHSGKNWGSITASAGSHDCCKARHSSSKRDDRGALAHTESTPQLSAGFEQVALPELPA